MTSRLILPIIAATALVACSQESSEGLAQEDQATESYAPPEVAPSAAPGVAWEFGYDYSLADIQIAAVQEAHASACERLGMSQCRITGLTYRIDDEDKVAGMLQVKLDPRIARNFGKQATQIVVRNDGRLVTAEFKGDDVGTQIDVAQGQQASIQSRIADIERRLGSMRPGDREGTELQNQLDQLRREAAEARERITGGQQRLASTPMTFNYHGEGSIAGFDENPLKASWRLMVESTVTMISLLLKVIGALLPWAILLLLLVLLIRSRIGRGVRHWWNRAANRDEES